MRPDRVGHFRRVLDAPGLRHEASAMWIHNTSKPRAAFTSLCQKPIRLYLAATRLARLLPFASYSMHASSCLSVAAAAPSKPTPCIGLVFASRGFIRMSRWRAIRSLKRRTVGRAFPAPSSTTTGFDTDEIHAARRSRLLFIWQHPTHPSPRTSKYLAAQAHRTAGNEALGFRARTSAHSLGDESLRPAM